MRFLHTLNPPLMHRDFKSPNIMVLLAAAATFAYRFFVVEWYHGYDTSSM